MGSKILWLVSLWLALVVEAPPVLAQLQFGEVSVDLGLDFLHRHGGRGDFFMIETMGSGVVVFDYDLDFNDEDHFKASGDVGGCCHFDERFFYAEVL